MLPYLGPEMVRALQSRTNTTTPGPSLVKQVRVIGIACDRVFGLLSQSAIKMRGLYVRMRDQRSGDTNVYRPAPGERY